METYEQWLAYHQQLCGQVVRTDVKTDQPEAVAELSRLFRAELSRHPIARLTDASSKVAMSGVKLWSAGDHLRELKKHLPDMVPRTDEGGSAPSVCQLCLGSGYVHARSADGKPRKQRRTGQLVESFTVACCCSRGSDWADVISRPPKKSHSGHGELPEPERYSKDRHATIRSLSGPVTREEAEVMVRAAEGRWAVMIATAFLGKAIRMNADGTDCTERDLEFIQSYVPTAERRERASVGVVTEL